MSQKQSTERRHELRNNTEIVANQLTLQSEEIQALSESELLMVNAANDRGNGNSMPASRAAAN